MKRTIIILLIIALIPITLNAYTSEDTANSVVNSLKTEPEKWRHDAYKLYYFKDPAKFDEISESIWDSNANCVIWIANGPSGIEIQAPQRVKILDKEVRQFIWDTYQMWTNEHFAKVFDNVQKEVFEHPDDKKNPVISTLEEPESDESEFINLTPDEKGRPPKGLPVWFLVSGGCITVLGVIGMVIPIFLKRRKENKNG